MSDPRQLLVVFLKYPEAGKVKTRLAASLGSEMALRVYRELLVLTVRAAGQWGRVPGREVWLHFDPPDCAPHLQRWLVDSLGPGPRSMVLLPQPAGDLGTRLSAAFTDAFSIGYQCVICIGSDCPGVTCEALEAATGALVRTEMVLGPTLDGGYYLLGLSRPAPAVFQGIPWSTPGTFGATVAAAKSAGLKIELLPPLRDIDTEEDWRSWKERADLGPSREN